MLQLPLAPLSNILSIQKGKAMNAEQFAMAQKRVKKKKSFYKNLFLWVIFSGFFITMNVLVRTSFPWAIFPVGAWGIKVLLQAFDIFGFPGYGEDWEKRILEDEIRKIEMEDRLKQRYQELSTKERSEQLDIEEQLDLDGLRKIKKSWDDSELV